MKRGVLLKSADTLKFKGNGIFLEDLEFFRAEVTLKPCAESEAHEKVGASQPHTPAHTSRYVNHS
jgi:hypothetical protein